MTFNNDVPFVILDKDFNIILAHDDIKTQYPQLLTAGYFSRLLFGYSAEDFSQPFILDTALFSNHKLLVYGDGENIRCTVIKNDNKYYVDKQNQISYQMREPISSIFAILPAVADNINNDKPDKAISYLDEVYIKSYKLLRNVTNITLANKIINNSIVRKETINLSSLITSITESVKTVKRNITINCETEPGIMISGNRSLLTNGILNLFSNSFVYCTDEPVEINIRLSVKNKNAVFTYSDNSKGIKEEFQQMVFRPFFSKDPYGDNSSDPELGLGLFITKSAFECSGGNLLLTSTFGEGVKYTASLPLCSADTIIMESSSTDFLLNRYSEVFVQLCDSCTLPSLK
ncbi:MAG: HAMP domain-containing histidine kinase [Oscillospiraceae bacterium]|nr:HAMP domain-containing histidine kinase [Oscillospiraceae bacterium]